MDDQILKSVIEITEQRDLDSLEYSLIATLAELCTFDMIAIIKLIDSDFRHHVEESIRLDINKDNIDAPDYLWSTQGDLVKPCNLVLSCIETGAKVDSFDESGCQCYGFPIKAGKELVGVLKLCGANSVKNSVVLVQGFVKIYENYLFILNESERDKLTGLLNRKTFDKKLARLLKAQRESLIEHVSDASSQRRTVSDDANAWLVLVDVDHFKRVNDEYGHVYGDEVLLHLSQLMKRFFRSSDLLFRFGGEEFVIVLEPINSVMATSKLNEFRQAVSEYEFPLAGRLTISMGYISITESDYPLTALDNADKALYFAKSNGRNTLYNYEYLVASGEISAPVTEGSVDLF